MSDICIGIDLGTTNSCVGVWQNNAVEIIANDQGVRTTPSFVAFNENERIIGNGAKSQSAQNPANTVYDAKRLIGMNYSDSKVQSDLKHLTYDVKPDGNNKPLIHVSFKGEQKAFKPEEISFSPEALKIVKLSGIDPSSVVANLKGRADAKRVFSSLDTPL